MTVFLLNGAYPTKIYDDIERTWRGSDSRVTGGPCFAILNASVLGLNARLDPHTLVICMQWILSIAISVVTSSTRIQIHSAILFIGTSTMLDTTMFILSWGRSV